LQLAYEVVEGLDLICMLLGLLVDPLHHGIQLLQVIYQRILREHLHELVDLVAYLLQIQSL
jgi:hypothetical protein